MAAYKEIVTKAIVGKGKKSFINNYQLETEVNPTTVLGCWVINHKFKGYKTGEQVGVNGSYDVNIWYSHDNDSKTLVVNKKIEYNDLFNVRIRSNADLSEETDIIVRTLSQPNCSDVRIEGNQIHFTIAKELGVEIVGETKMKIAIEEDEEPWDILEDEVSEEDITKIDAEVNEDYL
jgi:Outer spore coat protein E (CotE).